MGLSKPYYRIARPKAYIPNYVTDDRYAFDRLQLSRAYVNIEKQLRDIFNHIEPDEANKTAFSFDIFCKCFLEKVAELFPEVALGNSSKLQMPDLMPLGTKYDNADIVYCY